MILRSCSNQVIKTYFEYFSKSLQLNIGNKSFSTLYSLYGILIHIYTNKLHFIGKASL